MKTENTLDKKVKFFSQYWGLNVVNFRGKTISVYCTLDEKPISDCFLELKPLESISEEDGIELGLLHGWSEPENFKSFWLRTGANPKGCLQVDYLRSKSYALPWMDLTVQDLIDYGWIKLTEQ